MPTWTAVDRSVRRQGIVRLVWALCGLAVALAVSALLLQALEPRPVAVSDLVQDALLVALELSCVIVGALISVHRPGNRVGGLLLAGALALSVFSFLENYFGYVAGSRVFWPIFGRWRGSPTGRSWPEWAPWC